jgi:hypothetical protein
MNIPLISWEDLNNFWLKPGRAFVSMLINKKKSRLVYSIKPATFALKNEHKHFSYQHPENTLFYIGMDSEAQKENLVLIRDIKKQAFRIVNVNETYKKAVIGVVIEVFSF